MAFMNAKTFKDSLIICQIFNRLIQNRWVTKCLVCTVSTMQVRRKILSFPSPRAVCTQYFLTPQPACKTKWTDTKSWKIPGSYKFSMWSVIKVVFVTVFQITELFHNHNNDILPDLNERIVVLALFANFCWIVIKRLAKIIHIIIIVVNNMSPSM